MTLTMKDGVDFCMNQTGFARFDTATGKFELHPLPQLAGLSGCSA
jgi:hypothetical protein